MSPPRRPAALRAFFARLTVHAPLPVRILASMWISLTGLAAIVWGVAQWSPPAAGILLGVLLLALDLRVDHERRLRQRGLSV
jgi:hypothetical protein